MSISTTPEWLAREIAARNSEHISTSAEVVADYTTPDLKPTNPKDAIGSDKLPMHLVPSSLIANASLAFLEGALKYGKYNWRVAGVRTSIYLDAMQRHIAKFQNGEWHDPITEVPHLASVIACAGIILDAVACNKLIDDRPPQALAIAGDIDGAADHVKFLKSLFKDHSPKQYTIEETN